MGTIRWNEHSSGSFNTLPAGQIEEIRMIDGMIAQETLHDLENSRTGRYLYDINVSSGSTFFKVIEGNVLVRTGIST